MTNAQRAARHPDFELFVTRTDEAAAPFPFGGGVRIAPDTPIETFVEGVPERGAVVVGDGCGEANGHLEAYLPGDDFAAFTVQTAAMLVRRGGHGPALLHDLRSAVRSRFEHRFAAASVDLGVLTLSETGFGWSAVGLWMLAVRNGGIWRIVHAGHSLGAEMRRRGRSPSLGSSARTTPSRCSATVCGSR